MSTSYTALLGLAQPTTGELNGTWGLVVNTQLVQLIEDAVAGTAIVSVTSGDVTLSTTTGGAQNQARMSSLVFTGTPGVTRNIYAPPSSKNTILVNDSNAAIQFRAGPTTPTTGVTLPAGQQCAVTWDSNAGDFVIVSIGNTGTWNINVSGNAGGTAANATNLGGVAATAYAQLAQNQSWTKAQRGAYTQLTDAATIALDLSLANMYCVQLGGNRAIGLPTNAVAGQSGVIDIYQDSTGSRTLSWPWCFQWPNGTVPTLTTSARAKDKIAYSVDVYQQSTVTIAIPSGVVSYPGHGLLAGQQVQLVTTGALPTGLATNTTYFVVPIDANSFSLAATKTGAAITTTGTQSGVHTLTAYSITGSLIRGIA